MTETTLDLIRNYNLSSKVSLVSLIHIQQNLQLVLAVHLVLVVRLSRAHP